jgi:Kelch motif/Galactose oxidase, central domain
VILLAVAVLTCALLAPAIAAAAGSGSFSPTGSLGSVRGSPAAAPLPDGRVLVAGGVDGSNMTLDGAEAFDPAAGSFSSAGIGPLVTGRYNAAAAPLPDGRVLVAGGNQDASILPNANAEIFDPASGSFSSAGIGPMVVPRSNPAAAPLPDGRVLLAGGNNNTGFLDSAEVFNPRTNTFIPVGDMGSVRTGAVAAPLPDGRVLVAGGRDDDPIHASAEIFDPQTDTFSSAGIGSMGTARVGAVAAPLPDGRVLVAGGANATGDPSGAEAFDPNTNTFSSVGIGSLGTPRSGAAAAPLPDGRVLVAGGQDSANYLQSAELFALAPRLPFKFRLRGKRLIFTAPVAGTVGVSAAKSGTAKMATRNQGRKPGIRPSSASGGPGKITVALRLAGKAKRHFKAKGRAKVRAKISFTPSGQCLESFSACYDAGTETAKLKFKKKRKRNMRN